MTGNRPPCSRKQSLKTAVALALIYANGSVIVCAFFPGKQGMPPVLADFFLLFGVFGYYETINRELVIEGLPESAALDNAAGDRIEEVWVKLDLEKYFPFSRGERQSRINAGRTIGPYGWSRAESRDFLAARIKARYNLGRIEGRLERIRVTELRWPRSTAGYFAMKKRGHIVHQQWYPEPPRRGPPVK